MRSEMVSAIEDMNRSMLNNMHVALPGVIEEYDPNTGLCRVKPIGSIKIPDGTAMGYPVIAGVPICCPDGITVPVRSGTSCLIIICDADVSGWVSGKDAAQYMWHSLQNAVCIPGLRKTKSSLQNYANENNCVAIEGTLHISGNLDIAGNVSVSGSVTCQGSCNAPNIN